MRRLTLLLLLLALLWGCAATPDTATTQPTIGESTAQTVPETEPQPIPLEAVNPLSPKSFCASPAVAILDARTAAFVTTEYKTGQGITVSHLMVLDLYTDTVLAETTMERVLSIPVQSQLPGFLPLFDQASGQCLLMDRNLEILHTFDCPESNGVFAPDMTAYYYISAQRICRMDLATGETEVLSTELTLPVERITDYHPGENILLVEVHTQYYLTDLCVGAVDLDTGALLLLTEEAQQCCFTSDGILLQSSQVATSSDVVRAGWDSPDALELTGILPCDSVDSSRPIPGSDYLITLHRDARQSYNLSSFMLCRFREGYSGCELFDLTDGMEPDKLLALPDGNLLAVDYSRRATDIMLICPEQLTFSELSTPNPCTVTFVDDAIPESYREQSAPVEVPKVLAKVRAQADALEEKYDITILLSNQCDSIITQCGFTLQPTDEADLANEAKLLKAALKELEDALALYPEGFFSQFRNKARERGILVLLVENITAGITDDNVDVLGVTYDMGDWYPIAVDITTRKLNRTYCHEIWHAMENKIMDEKPTLLNDVMWAKCNPSDFSYQGIVEGYYNDTKYTYMDGNAGKNSYFVDAYGKTMPQEDRARLMEYIMTTDFTAEKMMNASVLYRKMEIMITAIRGVFDTTGWENVRWERFHPTES